MKKKAKKSRNSSARAKSVSSKAPKAPFEPLGDRVLIKAFSEEESSKTKSGLYIPETASKDNSFKKGKVVAVGPGRYEEGRLVPINLKVGDVVSFQWGEKISVNGEDHYVVREGEVAMRHN